MKPRFAVGENLHDHGLLGPHLIQLECNVSPKKANSNPYEYTGDVQVRVARRNPRTSAVWLSIAGVVTGLIGLELLVNRFGDTDSLGFRVIPVAGLMFGTGISRFFVRWRSAITIGIFTAMSSVVALVAAYWGGVC